ncbi:MAG: hypothetical protein P1U34_00315 [Coxiellaceae bacterium]|nr:hypothetical protein [Coxiellaceae bacterium]
MTGTRRSGLSNTQQQALSQRNKHNRNAALFCTVSTLALVGLGFIIYRSIPCFKSAYQNQTWDIMQKGADSISTKVGELYTNTPVKGSTIWDKFVTNIEKLGYTLTQGDSSSADTNSFSIYELGTIPVNNCVDITLNAAAKSADNIRRIYNGFRPALVAAGGSELGQATGILLSYGALVAIVASSCFCCQATKQRKLANKQRLIASTYDGATGVALLDKEPVDVAEEGLEMQPTRKQPTT